MQVSTAVNDEMSSQSERWRLSRVSSYDKFLCHSNTTAPLLCQHMKDSVINQTIAQIYHIYQIVLFFVSLQICQG